MSVFDHIPTPEEITMHARFQEWCEVEQIDATLWFADRLHMGYSNPRTQDYWTGFKAAYKLMLTTPTQGEVNKAIDTSSPYFNPQNKVEMKIHWLRRADVMNMVQELFRARREGK